MSKIILQIQGWIYWGCAGGVCTPLALARGGAGSGDIFHDKQKIIRDKMRSSNLSNI
jgi:hypothetical protein